MREGNTSIVDYDDPDGCFFRLVRSLVPEKLGLVIGRDEPEVTFECHGTGNDGGVCRTRLNTNIYILYPSGVCDANPLGVAVSVHIGLDGSFHIVGGARELEQAGEEFLATIVECVLEEGGREGWRESLEEALGKFEDWNGFECVALLSDRSETECGDVSNVEGWPQALRFSKELSILGFDLTVEVLVPIGNERFSVPDLTELLDPAGLNPGAVTIRCSRCGDTLDDLAGGVANALAGLMPSVTYNTGATLSVDGTEVRLRAPMVVDIGPLGQPLTVNVDCEVKLFGDTGGTCQRLDVEKIVASVVAPQVAEGLRRSIGESGRSIAVGPLVGTVEGGESIRSAGTNVEVGGSLEFGGRTIGGYTMTLRLAEGGAPQFSFASDEWIDELRESLRGVLNDLGGSFLPLEITDIRPRLAGGIPESIVVSTVAKVSGLFEISTPDVELTANGLRFTGPEEFAVRFETGFGIPAPPMVIEPTGGRIGRRLLAVDACIGLATCNASPVYMNGTIEVALEDQGALKLDGELFLQPFLELGRAAAELNLTERYLETEIEIGGSFSDIMAFRSEMRLDMVPSARMAAALRLFTVPVGNATFYISFADREGRLLASVEFNLLDFITADGTFQMDPGWRNPRAEATAEAVRIGGWSLAGLELGAKPRQLRAVLRLLGFRMGFVLPGLAELTPDVLWELIWRLLIPDLRNLDQALLAILQGKLVMNPLASFGSGAEAAFSSDARRSEEEGAGDAGQTDGEDDTEDAPEAVAAENDRQGEKSSAEKPAALNPPGQSYITFEASDGGYDVRMTKGTTYTTIAHVPEHSLTDPIFDPQRRSGQPLTFGAEFYAHLGVSTIGGGLQPAACVSGRTEDTVFVFTGDRDTPRAGYFELCRVAFDNERVTLGHLEEWRDLAGPFVAGLSQVLSDWPSLLYDDEGERQAHRLERVLRSGWIGDVGDVRLAAGVVRPGWLLVVADMPGLPEAASCLQAPAASGGREGDLTVKLLSDPDLPDTVGREYMQQVLPYIRAAGGCASPHLAVVRIDEETTDEETTYLESGGQVVVLGDEHDDEALPDQPPADREPGAATDRDAFRRFLEGPDVWPDRLVFRRLFEPEPDTRVGTNRSVVGSSVLTAAREWGRRNSPATSGGTVDREELQTARDESRGDGRVPMLPGGFPGAVPAEWPEESVSIAFGKDGNGCVVSYAYGEQRRRISGFKRDLLPDGTCSPPRGTVAVGGTPGGAEGENPGRLVFVVPKPDTEGAGLYHIGWGAGQRADVVDWASLSAIRTMRAMVLHQACTEGELEMRPQTTGFDSAGATKGVLFGVPDEARRYLVWGSEVDDGLVENESATLDNDRVLALAPFMGDLGLEFGVDAADSCYRLATLDADALPLVGPQEELSDHVMLEPVSRREASWVPVLAREDDHGWRMATRLFGWSDVEPNAQAHVRAELYASLQEASLREQDVSRQRDESAWAFDFGSRNGVAFDNHVRWREEDDRGSDDFEPDPDEFVTMMRGTLIPGRDGQDDEAARVRSEINARMVLRFLGDSETFQEYLKRSGYAADMDVQSGIGMGLAMEYVELLQAGVAEGPAQESDEESDNRSMTEEVLATLRKLVDWDTGFRPPSIDLPAEVSGFMELKDGNGCDSVAEAALRRLEDGFEPRMIIHKLGQVDCATGSVYIGRAEKTEEGKEALLNSIEEWTGESGFSEVAEFSGDGLPPGYFDEFVEYLRDGAPRKRPEDFHGTLIETPKDIARSSSKWTSAPWVTRDPGTRDPGTRDLVVFFADTGRQRRMTIEMEFDDLGDERLDDLITFALDSSGSEFVVHSRPGGTDTGVTVVVTDDREVSWLTNFEIVDDQQEAGERARRVRPESWAVLKPLGGNQRPEAIAHLADILDAAYQVKPTRFRYPADAESSSPGRPAAPHFSIEIIETHGEAEKPTLVARPVPDGPYVLVHGTATPKESMAMGLCGVSPTPTLPTAMLIDLAARAVPTFGNAPVVGAGSYVEMLSRTSPDGEPDATTGHVLRTCPDAPGGLMHLRLGSGRGRQDDLDRSAPAGLLYGIGTDRSIRIASVTPCASGAACDAIEELKRSKNDVPNDLAKWLLDELASGIDERPEIELVHDNGPEESTRVLLYRLWRDPPSGVEQSNPMERGEDEYIYGQAGDLSRCFIAPLDLRFTVDGEEARIDDEGREAVAGRLVPGLIREIERWGCTRGIRPFVDRHGDDAKVSWLP